MKREDLEKLGLTAEQIDKVMAENGKDIEKHKTAAETAKTENDGLKAQLAEANKQIEGFKDMKPEDLKKAAADWQVKAEKAEADRVAEVSRLKFDHALDGALTGAKAKNTKAVKALLDAEGLKYNEADGSIIGLKEQLEKIKSDNDYLFEGETTAPKIVTGGNNKTVISDAVVMQARKAAGLSVEGDK